MVLNSSEVLKYRMDVELQRKAELDRALIQTSISVLVDIQDVQYKSLTGNVPKWNRT